jgi:cephalosporin-C deacetylase
MTVIAKRKKELANYQAEITLDAAIIDAYWDKKLEQLGQLPLGIRREQQPSLFPAVKIDKLTYLGHDGTPIHAWFLEPERKREGAPVSEKPPCVIIFPGYGGDKGLPERHATWLMLGYAVLAIDARGQSGETGNHMQDQGGSAHGWVSRNVLDKENSYYMGLATDVVRAVEVAYLQPEIDTNRIAAVGTSQGGGMALLAGALSPKVTAVAASIPNMCHLEYGVLNSTGSLSEIANFVKRHPDKLEGVLATLSYFDIVNLAHRIHVPVLMSVGWKDMICMPDTVYAAFNRLTCRKRIYDYPFSGHETGEEHHRRVHLFIQECFGDATLEIV